jgi:pimeloyl-ACP methyl ester carboxylesterase
MNKLINSLRNQNSNIPNMNNNYVVLTDNRKLGYEDHGDETDTAIMFFHGTPGSRISGLEDSPLMNTFNVRIITPERPGYGISDPFPNRKISDWAMDIKELAVQLGIRKFHVAGGSGGGAYALACAIKLSEYVISTTLISAAPPPEIPDFSKGMSFGNKISFFFARHMPFVLKLMNSQTASYVQKYPDKFIKKMYPQLCEWDKRVIDSYTPKERNVFIQSIQEAYRQGITGAQQDILLISRSWNLQIDQIKSPIFLWHGEADTLVPVAPAQDFTRYLNNCDIEIIAGAGHLLMDDDEIAGKIIGKMVKM